jgi:peptidyl-tRNA hydrolase, PTH1 family
VVGLGNPGIEYVNSRHNAGAEVVAALAERHQARLRPEKGLHAQVAEVRIGGFRVLLAIPTTFMNESGQAVAPLVRRAGVDQPDPDTTGDAPSGATGTATAATGAAATAGPVATATPSRGRPDEPLAERLIVVHDELDLPSGRVKIKAGGGNAGNNGLKSIESHLHTNRYLRVRVGIGKPPGRQPGADYVLKRPGAAERAVLMEAIELAADAVEAIVTEGLAAAMNRVNTAEGGSA